MLRRFLPGLLILAVAGPACAQITVKPFSAPAAPGSPAGYGARLVTPPMPRAAPYSRPRADVEADAAKGDIPSMLYLALLDRADAAASARWFKAAADQGDGRAAEIVGGLYLRGSGVAKDPQTAIRYFTAAADKGQRGAMASLGHLYAEGKDVPADPVAAERWLKMAIDKGDGDALFALSKLYETGGKGVPANPVEAARLKKAYQDYPFPPPMMASAPIPPRPLAERQGK